MENKGVLLEQISKPMSEKEMQTLQFLQENDEWLKKSRRIALNVLYFLEQKGMTKKDLAAKMNVTPTYVGKLLKGKENLSLETISKIESALNVNLVNIERPYADQDKAYSKFSDVQSYA